MLNELLTFLIFLLIGIEIRESLQSPKALITPTIAALGGMAIPAMIFLTLLPANPAWAVVMPTDAALALGALSLLGKRIQPQVRTFLMTLAVADDFFSLVIIGIFFPDDLHLASAIYTLGAATLGFILPAREFFMQLLGKFVPFIIIPIYAVLNLFLKIDFSVISEPVVPAIVMARVFGKAIGILLFALLAVKIAKAQLPTEVDYKEITGIGFLSGIGMTVSLVIADITVSSESELAAIRCGLLLAALLSALIGYLWFRVFPASL